MPYKWMKNSCRRIHTSNLEWFWLVSLDLYLSSANYRTIHFCTSPEVCACVLSWRRNAHEDVTFQVSAVTGQHLGNQQQRMELRFRIPASCGQSVGAKKVREAGARHRAGSYCQSTAGMETGSATSMSRHPACFNAPSQGIDKLLSSRAQQA